MASSGARTGPEMQISLASEGDGVKFGLEFLAEGAANIVYKLLALNPSGWPDGTPNRSTIAIEISSASPEAVSGKLLRVSKVSTFVIPQLGGPPKPTADDEDEQPQGTDDINAIEDGPSASPEEEKGQLHFYETVVKSSFDPSNIIELEPVLIDSDAIIALNNELEGLEGQGLARQGSRIPPSQPEAFFVTDMTSDPEKSFSLEIKPKWLTQSPSAPSEARRCRTCALKVYRQKTGAGQGFCPMNFFSGDRKQLKPIVEMILKGNPFKSDSQNFFSKSEKEQVEIKERLIHFFGSGGQGHDTLRSLHDFQMMHDPKGVLEVVDAADQGGKPDPEGLQNLCKAMTFRDCSMFLKIYWDGSDIEARLGDLDLKKATKLESWVKIERELIYGGWYLGKDENSDCFLAE